MERTCAEPAIENAAFEDVLSRTLWGVTRGAGEGRRRERDFPSQGLDTIRVDGPAARQPGATVGRRRRVASLVLVRTGRLGGAPQSLAG